MVIDINKMRRLQSDLYVAAVTQAYGSEGIETLRKLIELIIQVYRRVDPGTRIQPLAFFCAVKSISKPLPKVKYVLSDPSLVHHELDDACAAQIMGREGLHIRLLSDLDLAQLSNDAIVYRYAQGEEQFIIAGQTFQLTNPANGYASVFAKPTFTTLRSALDHYRARSALDSTCMILKTTWKDDRQRWYFSAKPEATMRRSLTQYLSNVLQDAEVRPEQIVDESHPVDIKVSWTLSDQRAIIEIKWLGDSMDEDGKPTTPYRDSRARDGAKQLADYLDASRTFGSSVKTRGYLVVFDGRRRGLSEAMTRLSQADGSYYRDTEIAYDPDYNAARSDFEVPMRFFLNPICL